MGYGKPNKPLVVTSCNIPKYVDNIIKHLVKSGVYLSRSNAIRVYIDRGIEHDALKYALIQLPEIEQSYRELAELATIKKKIKDYEDKYEHMPETVEINGKKWKILHKDDIK